MADPKPFPRTFVIIAFGPLVGAVVMCVLMIFSLRPWAQPEPWTLLFQAIILYLSFGWVAGLLPAIASALLWRFAIPAHWSRQQRVLAALVIGAITGTVLIWPFMSFFFGHYAPDFRFHLLAGTCGAIALLATTLWGDRR